MKWLAHALLVILPVLVPPGAAAQGFCGFRDNTGQVALGDLYSDDPTTLAAAWVPPLERLSAAIPSLSPQEDRWLDEEYNGGADRLRRAVNSREFALREAKRNAGSLLAMVRRLTEERDPSARSRDWLWFAYLRHCCPVN